MTELKDTFDINLEWIPDDREGGGPLGGAWVLRAAPAASPTCHPPRAPIAGRARAFAAVQERLGLKLEGRKGAVDIVVVDSAEKAPTQN